MKHYTSMSDSDGLRFGELCSNFLHYHRQRIEAKEPDLRPLSFREYAEECDLLVADCGLHRAINDLRPDDFQEIKAKMSRQWGSSPVGKFISLIRAICDNGKDNGLIEKEVLFGKAFKLRTSSTATVLV